MPTKQKKGGINEKAGRDLLFKSSDTAAETGSEGEDVLSTESPEHVQTQVEPPVEPAVVEAPQPSPTLEPAATSEPEKPSKPKSNRVRTTLTILPKTMAAIELLRYDARRTGKKATMSDVIDEAVAVLLEQRHPTNEQL